MIWTRHFAFKLEKKILLLENSHIHYFLNVKKVNFLFPEPKLPRGTHLKLKQCERNDAALENSESLERANAF